MKYEFHPEALDEFEDAARWYARKQPGLERRFISSVEEAIDDILEAPDRWSVLEDDVRICLTRVFPYQVLYTIESDCVVILAVMHCRREPGYWRKRK